jgi:hypothetical protein
MGIFEWNRASMGTQPAGGYFEHMIAFVVLAGKTYKILESYIDDIFVHAQTKEKLFENLKLIFERIRKYNTHDGIQFSKKKRNGVNDIPIPTTKDDLKKFLGVANYFRDHVRNHSMLAQPLQLLLPDYSRAQRNHKLAWPEESKDLFLTPQVILHQ